MLYLCLLPLWALALRVCFGEQQGYSYGVYVESMHSGLTPSS